MINAPVRYIEKNIRTGSILFFGLQFALDIIRKDYDNTILGVIIPVTVLGMLVALSILLDNKEFNETNKKSSFIPTIAGVVVIFTDLGLYLFV